MRFCSTKHFLSFIKYYEPQVKSDFSHPLLSFIPRVCPVTINTFPPSRPNTCQIKPAQTAATATTADIPLRNTFPLPRTTPELVDCVGVLALLVLVSVPVEVVVDVGGGAAVEVEAEGGLLTEENTPPATLAGVVLSVVFEAARA
jgi:hypothetical protein